ncbi:hypothetical protein CALK_2378 [Chitinivibrio alkaliphilus ACht1]|uniref:Uncharacterized protein n=1 Tax=Chitinivibrio alkaliphilus ACht1 TaxID=1313304 RepID=U7D5C9_9BACT|nr:hypothetical protein CALK_2378 [Chitinivibrio alkaliphilus ACht1]
MKMLLLLQKVFEKIYFSFSVVMSSVQLSCMIDT